MYWEFHALQGEFNWIALNYGGKKNPKKCRLVRQKLNSKVLRPYADTDIGVLQFTYSADKTNFFFLSVKSCLLKKKIG